jgi:hypothetical protein
MGSSSAGRPRVERGIERQPNGKCAVRWRRAGRLHFRTIGFDLAEAQRDRVALIAATREGKVPVSPRLRFETVAGRWLERANVAAGERHPRTHEAHRYQLGRHLLPSGDGGSPQKQARVKTRTGRLAPPYDSNRGVCRELRNHAQAVAVGCRPKVGRLALRARVSERARYPGDVPRLRARGRAAG